MVHIYLETKLNALLNSTSNLNLFANFRFLYDPGLAGVIISIVINLLVIHYFDNFKIDINTKNLQHNSVFNIMRKISELV